MLWQDFESDLPLMDSILDEQPFGSGYIRNVRFYGRKTEKGRVLIYGVYALNKNVTKKQSCGTILLIQDLRDSINYELINYYFKQGYNVLMVDYAGKSDNDNYTVYPEDISYANLSACQDTINKLFYSAKETCWYEWVAVMKYALSYLKNQPGVYKIGVVGIKDGSNIGWMLCGTSDIPDCFVSLFGAGWRAYRGKFKYSSDDDIAMDEERIRFLAGLEVQAYAQGVTCPVLYQTATNSPDFDIDRSVDTLVRVHVDKKIDEDNGVYNCYAPRLRDVLDKSCMRNVDLFLAKFLLGYKVSIPFEPALTLTVNNNKVNAKVDINFSDTKRTKRTCVYVTESSINPAYRDWNLMAEHKSSVETEKSFSYTIKGNSDFILAFALVEYKNGVTVCSKIQYKKITEVVNRDNKLVYSAKDKLSSFSVFNVAKYSTAGLYFNDEDYVLTVQGPNEISGVTSKYGLISYKVNPKYLRLGENSLIKMDVYSEVDTMLNLVLMMVDSSGIETDYCVKILINGASVWQNIMVKGTDFKSAVGRTIKDFSLISAFRIEAETICVINNILMI